MKKMPKQAYISEIKEFAVKRATEMRSIPAVAKELGLSFQSLRNWSSVVGKGKLECVGSKVVTPEAIELSRLRADIARLKRENEVIKSVHA